MNRRYINSFISSSSAAAVGASASAASSCAVALFAKEDAAIKMSIHESNCAWHYYAVLLSVTAFDDATFFNE